MADLPQLERHQRLATHHRGLQGGYQHPEAISYRGWQERYFPMGFPRNERQRQQLLRHQRRQRVCHSCCKSSKSKSTCDGTDESSSSLGSVSSTSPTPLLRSPVRTLVPLSSHLELYSRVSTTTLSTTPCLLVSPTPIFTSPRTT